MTSAGSRLGLLAPLAALLAVALGASLIEGSPRALPGIAIGSVVLLYAERAVALFGLVVAVLSVLTEAARGRLPTQVSTAGLAYADEFTHEAEAPISGLQRQVETSRGRSGAPAPPGR